jgi:hypothetical protein
LSCSIKIVLISNIGSDDINNSTSNVSLAAIKIFSALTVCVLFPFENGILEIDWYHCYAAVGKSNPAKVALHRKNNYYF